MRLPIDTTTIKFAAAGAAEPVLDFATKSPKLDDQGVPIYAVPVFAAGSGIKDSITIKVAGEVKGLSEFTLVKITNLVAQTWEVGDNHGVRLQALPLRPLPSNLLAPSLRGEGRTCHLSCLVRTSSWSTTEDV